MALNQRPQNRRARRQRADGPSRITASPSALPGILGLLTNPKLFAAISLIFVAGIGLSVLAGGIIKGPTLPSSAGDSDSPIKQANELPDAPLDDSGTPVPQASPAASVPVKRYTAPPALTVDMTRTYRAVLKTAKGDIEIELYPQAAPEAVNAFIFLAREGYYNGTPFMELVRTKDGNKFYTQAGDPTRTGLGTPGFFVKKEYTNLPFARGAVGMGGTTENSNGGQFFISFGDYPTLTGKYTVFGKVISGMDVLDRLSLLQIADGRGSGPSDEIESVTVLGDQTVN